MKKIRCPFGPESVENALREVESYKLFDTPYIIKAIDSTTVQEPDGSKTVYIILPYYPKGNLQDIINSNLVTGSHVPEDEIWRIIHGICLGLKAMHKHVVRGGVRIESNSMARSKSRGSAHGKNRKDKKQRLMDSMSSDTKKYQNLRQSDEGDSSKSVITSNEEDEDQRQLLSDTELEGGSEDDSDIFDYGEYNNNGENIDDEFDINSDNDDATSSNALPMGSIVPYAHRDLKPANVMLDESNRPVLMDLGSTTRARVNVSTRQSALALQDLAAEHCTLPYRAPELLYVKTGSSVDEKTDMWSLGCTIYALMYNSSPFELQAAESGASLAMAIQSGKFEFPSGTGIVQYSEKLKDVVNTCLALDPSVRASVDQVLRISEEQV